MMKKVKLLFVFIYNCSSEHIYLFFWAIIMCKITFYKQKIINSITQHKFFR